MKKSIVDIIREEIEHIDDVPIDISNPDRLEKDLYYNEFRNGAYHYGAIDTTNPDEKLTQMFQDMESGKIPVRKEYTYLKNRGSGAIILALKIYENGWAVVFSISQRQKFPVVIETPLSYGIYSEFVFPPNKIKGAFDFVRIEKDDLMKKGFHIHEELSTPVDNTWAIFKIKWGQKCFITGLSGGDNKLFGSCHYQVKYSDPIVLKFSLEEAKELVERNKSAYETYGLVNDKGMQLVKGKYDDVWQKGRLSEDESETTKPKLILPVGISGSGKSTWIKSQTDSNTIVISPDEIRRELSGNISDQTQNAKVWALAFKRTADALNAGKNVILDATNIKSSERKNLMNYMKVHVDKPIEGLAKIFDVSPEIAKQRVRKDIEAGVDRSNVPDWAIDRQYQSFIDGINSIETDGFKIID